jgi:hypothetical protein
MSHFLLIISVFIKLNIIDIIYINEKFFIIQHFVLNTEITNDNKSLNKLL